MSGSCLSRAQEGKCLKDYLHTSDIINGSVQAGPGTRQPPRDGFLCPQWPGLREAELCEENTCETITASLMTRPLPRVSVSGSGMSGLACGDNNYGISIIPAHFITHRGPGLTSDQCNECNESLAALSAVNVANYERSLLQPLLLHKFLMHSLAF